MSEDRLENQPPRPRRALVTGATGFVGAFLADALLRAGREIICLVRPNPDQPGSIDDRLYRVFEHVRPGKGVRATCAVSGDIVLPLAGVSSEDRRVLRGTVDEIWHCAAATSFALPADTVFRTNVTGTEMLLDLAEDLQAKRFRLISTAYVCDCTRLYAEEGPITRTDGFRNAYEKSKRNAEERVLSRVGTGDYIDGSIFRLPVTLGDFREGITTQYLGYYSLAKAIPELHRVLQRWDANNIDAHVRILCVPGATVNILPVDRVVDTIVRCVDSSDECNGVFHITNGTAPTVRFLYETTLQFFGIAGVQVMEGETRMPLVVPARSDVKAKRCASLLRQSMKYYVPYMSGEPRFLRATLEQRIGSDNLPDVDIDAMYLGRVLRFALEHDWKCEK